MNENLLVAAKSEYTEQLQEILCENIYSGIKVLWVSAKETEKVNTLKCFQKKLCAIPEWNQEIINKVFKTLLKKTDISNDYIDKIIEAVFLSNVKILSVVKTNNKSQNINVSIPDTKHFIHRCYIESARCFYSDPYLIDDREKYGNTQVEIQRNIKRSINIIKISIEKTIRSMIPMEEILKKYLDSENYTATYEKTNSEKSQNEEEIEQEHYQEEVQENEVQEDEVQEDEQEVDDLFKQEPEPIETKNTPSFDYNQPFNNNQDIREESSPLVVDLKNVSVREEQENFFD